uniref:DNA-directed primase/polymerase protein isoform X1 n=1 Tax=Fragaria vesca subsp. vesca TaxID=101020 RepID=UPI0005C9C74D|nr:PREDICTED: DNA-directed primase/polymerase protein isoform X1 [Fragaria vesca subsp. vesca]
MDDVDRLFECFKCGISPPQSALRERKRIKSKPNQRSKAQEVDSPRSPEQIKKIASDLQLSAEKGGSATAEAKSVNRRKQLSPVVFYGSPNGVPPKQPSRLLLRVLREIRVDLTAQKRLSSSLFRKEVWATFPRQEEAMQFAKRNENVHVFSYQDHFSGQRRFLVSSYDEFWRRYKFMDSKFRHHYEVIQEGLPCHLYFDLEFNKKDNTDRNGDEMVDLLISVVFEALLEKYSIQGNMEWIIELDSSTEAKFSRHLIVRIQKTAFKDNSHIGGFVTEICSRISSAKGRDGRFEKLFITKDSSSGDLEPSHLFVDTAVYTRNRCFRLALSSKAGKKSVLLPTGRFKAKDMMQSEEEMFMASLICNLDADCEKLLVCKSDLDCIKTLHFDTEVNPSFGKSYSWPQEFALSGCTSDASATYFMGKSPFPALDAFVEFVATIGNVSGKIRSWYWFSEFGLMVYSMSRNRYCERIGRQHKSNHVIYIADLRRGVYYQKCHDPDCRGYRSPSRPIPWNIVRDLVHECEKDHERVLFDDENTKSSGVTDSWWLEAIKVADEVENKQNSLELSNPKTLIQKMTMTGGLLLHPKLH